MIRIALVEDEAEVRAQLQGYVQRHTRQYGTEFAVTEFADGMELLDDYRPVYDVLFLDVEMKHLDGMETARRVRELDKDVIIVFITNMPQYAIGGYAVGALDYVLKPVPFFAFSQQLRKAEEQLRRRVRHYLARLLPHLLSGKRGPPRPFLHRGGGLRGGGHPESLRRKAGRAALCPLQQRLPRQSGAGEGGAAGDGAGGAL